MLENDDGARAPVVKSAEERKLVRKLNARILPFVFLAAFVQFADKSALSFAAILGLYNDTGITATEFSLLGSIFYAGYIAFQLPNSYLMQKFPIKKYLGTLLVLWGISVACTALCRNFVQLLVCRVILGLCEACTYPCLYIVVNSHYRRQEQSTVFAFLWLSGGMGSILSTLICYGIAHVTVSPWKWNYVVLGVLTVLIGVMTFFFLPDTPLSPCLQLTDDEKKIVAMRTLDNAVVREKEVKWYQYRECLREPRLYLVFLFACCNNLTNGGIVVFSNPFIQGLGFSALNTILLQLPTNLMTVIYCTTAVLVHRKTNSFAAGTAVCAGAGLVGCILLNVLPHTGIKLLGAYLAWGFNGCQVMLLSMIAANVSGYSKKLMYNAIATIGYTVGCFVGPLVMLAREAPVYRTGWSVFAAGYFVVIVCMATISFMAARTNKKRIARGISYTDPALNLTDREDKNYIYKL
ncbi:major facilitator superfamily domain-containing protein [Gongronella butleri]|nr:major facilitator superfamily domain-containing protein [Gongronella butleri]